MAVLAWIRFQRWRANALHDELAYPHARPEPEWERAVVKELQGDVVTVTGVDIRGGIVYG